MDGSICWTQVTWNVKRESVWFECRWILPKQIRGRISWSMIWRLWKDCSKLQNIYSLVCTEHDKTVLFISTTRSVDADCVSVQNLSTFIPSSIRDIVGTDRVQSWVDLISYSDAAWINSMRVTALYIHYENWLDSFCSSESEREIWIDEITGWESCSR